MIQIKSKHSGLPVETICNEEEFSIDDNYIYSKDEFGNKVQWDRKAFYATKAVKFTSNDNPFER